MDLRMGSKNLDPHVPKQCSCFLSGSHIWKKLFSGDWSPNPACSPSGHELLLWLIKTDSAVTFRGTGWSQIHSFIGAFQKGVFLALFPVVLLLQEPSKEPGMSTASQQHRADGTRPPSPSSPGPLCILSQLLHQGLKYLLLDFSWEIYCFSVCRKYALLFFVKM